jgi:lysophospholipase L1-like esterase
MSISTGLRFTIAALPALVALPAMAQPQKPADRGWVAAWTASAQGPYPVGNATVQPELRFALPAPERGANDQSFRLILRPDVWSREARIRLTNAFGTKPVTFDDIGVGLQTSGAVLVPRSGGPVTFAGKSSVTLAPGQSLVSDPVPLRFVKDRDDPMLLNRKLALSFHVAGESGPMTWHAEAMTTSYLSRPGGGSHGREEGDVNFPFSTTSWFFVDEVDMLAPGAQTIVAFGDSITDGTASTLNGDDRWPDVFARRLHAALGGRFSLVNAGIGGNMVIGPANYAATPFAGGPAATERLERDVLSLPSVTKIIWLEGINDFGNAGAEPEKVKDGVKAIVQKLRERLPGVRIYMATLTSALNSNNGGYGAKAIDEKRRAYNQFIRTAGIFDGVIDFDGATTDPATGEMKAEFQPNSTIGGPGDRLHPNRAGHAAMGNAISFPALFGLRNVSR